MQIIASLSDCTVACMCVCARACAFCKTCAVLSVHVIVHLQRGAISSLGGSDRSAKAMFLSAEKEVEKQEGKRVEW